MAEVKLKPCPFCGSEDVMVMNPRVRNMFEVLNNAQCKILCCDCEVSFDFGTYEKAYNELTDEDVEIITNNAVSNWNKRRYHI